MKPYAHDKTLTRGAFKSEAQAHEWARVKLQGEPYTLRYVAYCPLCGEDTSKPNPYGKHGCGFSQP